MKVIIDDIEYVPATPVAQGEGLDAALDVVIGNGDTVRGYFRDLMTELWEQQEGFSGKRPFGNSGWEWDLYVPLAKAKFIDMGAIDEDGCFESYTREQKVAAHAYVHRLITRAFEKP